MEYRIRSNGAVVELLELGPLFPQSYIGPNPTEEYLNDLGVDIVYPVDVPPISVTQKVSRDGIVLDNGIWKFVWKVENLPANQINTMLISRRKELMANLDNKIEARLRNSTRFSLGYVEREAAAIAFKDAGYTGDPTTWVSRFADNTGLTNTQATDLILSQAAAMRAALKALEEYRMDKYLIQAKPTITEAEAEYARIGALVDAVVVP